MDWRFLTKCLEIFLLFGDPAKSDFTSLIEDYLNYSAFYCTFVDLSYILTHLLSRLLSFLLFFFLLSLVFSFLSFLLPSFGSCPHNNIGTNHFVLLHCLSHLVRLHRIGE